MKRTLVIILFLIFYIPGFSQSNISGKIIYKANLKPIDISKITENKKLTNKTKQLLLSISNNAKDVAFKLKFNAEASLYKVISGMNSDAEPKLNLTKSVAGSDNIYYTNIPSKIFFYQTNGDDQLLNISYKPIKWSMTQETKKIGNYLCYKAVFENTEAWFAPTISVNFGPKKYNGLPGLILEVKKGGLSIKATKITLNPKKKVVIKKPKSAKTITEEEYYKNFNKMFKGF
ncbi:MAG: GLPGLI family protein [Lutibacter sp.]|uniref:GLPGLI family protein n=1 Tax=Lutibacter sp. TaxID=1925666 RepID=UPI00299D704C|nr:GLPGLI family protein [Lutibacter sp.]MDX1830298.1 GLPGLI family protein [Lutibacter sp.]